MHGPPAVGVEPDGPCRNNAPTIRQRREARWHFQRCPAELPDGSQTIEVAGAEQNPVFPNRFRGGSWIVVTIQHAVAADLKVPGVTFGVFADAQGHKAGVASNG